MIIVDKALEERRASGNPIRLGMVGAGYSGRTIAHQIIHAFPGISLVAMSNRTVEHARDAYVKAGVEDVLNVDSVGALEDAVKKGKPAVTNDASLLCKAGGIDVIIEATGTIEFGCGVVMEAIAHGKHVVLMNVELDATLGPIMKTYADRAGVVYTNTDGDEPGVAMNMFRFVRSIGLEPVVTGNLKGLYDPYRTPETQKAFAAQANQKPETMTHFADGTKLSMELNVLANASGFKVGKRGMYGPNLSHVKEAPAFYADKLIDGGMVDYLCGAEPGNGAFVVGYGEDPVRSDYLKYLKMGDGPLYVFYTPFHLPQLEIPLTVSRAVLFHDATVTPKGAPACESITVAKRDLKAGETLDGMGGFCSYALIEAAEVAAADTLLPMGVSAGCTLKHDVPKDQPLRYADVNVPAGRYCDELKQEQSEHFGLVDAPRAAAAQG